MCEVARFHCVFAVSALFVLTLHSPCLFVVFVHTRGASCALDILFADSE